MAAEHADLVRAQFRFLTQGSESEFHLDFTTDQPINVPFLETTGAGLANWIIDSLMGTLSHECVLVEIFMQSLDPDQPAQVTVTDGMPHAGGHNASALPNQTACVVSFVSDENTPSGRGRSYVPGFAAPDIANGLFTAAVTLAVSGAFDALAALAADPALLWVIYSVKEDVVNAVVAWTVRNVPGGLNKRRIGRGW